MKGTISILRNDKPIRSKEFKTTPLLQRLIKRWEQETFRLVHKTCDYNNTYSLSIIITHSREKQDKRKSINKQL